MDCYRTLTILPNPGSEVRNSFVFLVDANSGIQVPEAPVQPKTSDPVALDILNLLLQWLNGRGLSVTAAEFNKTGQACSSVSFEGAKLYLILGVRREVNRVSALLLTWNRKPKEKYFESDSIASSSEKVRETIYHILGNEMKVDSLQRLTERDAVALSRM
jgi:hypothetical protein